MHYTWDFSFVLRDMPLYLRGLAKTLELGFGALAIGLTAGLLIGFGRISRKATIRFAASCYVELFRDIPPLILLFWFFYALPLFLASRAPPFVAALIALTLYTAAYSAEIYRAGIQSIGRGQMEAAKAIGFSYTEAMRFVVLPQAIRRVVPALTNQSIEVVKSTALASTIAYGELLYQGKLVADEEYRPLESFTVVAVWFIVVLLALSIGARWLERHFAKAGSA